MNTKYLQHIYDELLRGNLSVINSEFSISLSNKALELLNKPVWNKLDLVDADYIIRISNVLYNNTNLDDDELPLNDGVYDQLIVMYKKYDENYNIGAIPVQFDELPQNTFEEKVEMCDVIATEDELKSKLYIKDIYSQRMNYNPRLETMCFIDKGPISKRLINTTHEYPELVGTLDKCKFVLNNDAIEKEVFDKPSVQVFERDFIQKHMMTGVIDYTQKFQMVGELKYDGVSVEAKVRGDRIIKALSRGDTADNVATDLSPIFSGYQFPCAKDVPTDVDFGMKFEAVITKRNLEKLNYLRGKNYKNCRNAIIGILSASDADRYVDYITLIPLATSLEMDRLIELEFINKYYNSGEYNRYCVFEGDYKSILFQVKQFTESAEIARRGLPYLIDGVVISYIDPKIIKTLGRVNSVNKYSIAIKFNPRRVKTIFLGYTFNIGKSGDVIPMVHFKPCEFMGAINTKQTLHSYKRFKELNLIKGQEIVVEHVNDVLSYITKPDSDFNRRIMGNPEKFIETCPYCGSKIEISESGKSAKCPNINCPERKLMRMVDLMDRLGFVDFSEERIRTLKIDSLYKLLNYTYGLMDDLYKLGPTIAVNFYNQLMNILDTPIEDYKLMSSLGFNDMAAETWKLILREFTIQDIVSMNYDELYSKLININGIGPKTAKTVCDSRIIYEQDLNLIMEKFKIINSKGMEKKPKIAFTGFRDSTFIEFLNNNGFDASDKYSVTKDTYSLITNDLNSTSSKMTKANKYGIPIMTKQQFMETNNLKII